MAKFFFKIAGFISALGYKSICWIYNNFIYNLNPEPIKKVRKVVRRMDFGYFSMTTMSREPPVALSHPARHPFSVWIPTDEGRRR